MLGWELTAEDMAVLNGFEYQQRMARALLDALPFAVRGTGRSVVRQSPVLDPRLLRRPPRASMAPAGAQVHGSMWLQKEGPYRTMEELWDEAE